MYRIEASGVRPRFKYEWGSDYGYGSSDSERTDILEPHEWCFRLEGNGKREFNSMVKARLDHLKDPKNYEAFQ